MQARKNDDDIKILEVAFISFYKIKIYTIKCSQLKKVLCTTYQAEAWLATSLNFIMKTKTVATMTLKKELEALNMLAYTYFFYTFLSVVTVFVTPIFDNRSAFSH